MRVCGCLCGLLLALALAATPVSAQSRYWVAAGGTGRSGTSVEDAFGSLAQARDALRARSDASITGDITVLVLPGTYRLTETLTLEARDSGRAGHAVIYRAAATDRPTVLSGGRRVDGWRVVTVNGRAAWQAALPKDLLPEGLRDLYVDGHRRPRARSQAIVPEGMWRNEKGQPLGLVLDGPEVAGYARPTDLQVRQQITWRHYILSVTGVQPGDRGRTNVALKEVPEWLAPTFVGFKSCAPVILENAVELLDEPGEWYFDRASALLTYLPMPGEDMAKVEVVAPAVERLLVIQGANDLRFEGLTFAEAGWTSPNTEGWFGYDPGFATKGRGLAGGLSLANVYATDARRVRFERCSFERLGGVGLHLNQVDDSQVNGCVFADISADGLGLGSVLDPKRAPERLSVTNNLFWRTNQDYRMGAALLAGKLLDAQIHHNMVVDVPYIGLLVNKLFGNAPARYGALSVRYNRIVNTMGSTADGGAFYTWMDGSSDGTPSVFSDNYISGVHGRDSQGVYLDNDCRYWTVERNVIDGTLGCWYLMKGSHHTLRDNYTDNARSRRMDLHQEPGIVEEGTVVDATANWAARPVAKATVEAAGLQPAYRDLLGRLPAGRGKNQAPTIVLAPSATTGLLDALRLTARLTDDGQPHNVLHYAWTKVSGPGEVSFYGQQTRALSLPVAFSVPGEYVLRLTATDLAAEVHADVKVTVTAADKGQEIAQGRPEAAYTASAVNTPGEAAARAFDGQSGTCWYPGFPGVGWVQVDLGREATLTRVEMLLRNDTGDHTLSRTEFEVLASNDPAFGSYTVLGQQGLDADPQAGGIWTANVPSGLPAFRYVRRWKRFGFDGVVNELRVYAR
ncbi:MAG: discoidin domain-containing protein [Armatimonadetes bacterium]|nr:discoidin domain-containing protein [Armatimonadota bacterium]